MDKLNLDSFRKMLGIEWEKCSEVEHFLLEEVVKMVMSEFKKENVDLKTYKIVFLRHKQERSREQFVEFFGIEFKQHEGEINFLQKTLVLKLKTTEFWETLSSNVFVEALNVEKETEPISSILETICKVVSSNQTR